MGNEWEECVKTFLKNIFLAILTASVSWGIVCAEEAPKPPEQPLFGPGGQEVSHASVTAQLHGEGALAYWLYEPAEPVPESAPLIVFNHGWSAMNPQVYQAWINHIVQRGNIVVYPLYQDSILTPTRDFTPNAIAAVKDAINVLQKEPGHVRPLLDKFAIVGHSMGGVISANMAADWKEEGLPFPRAVMCAEPGKTWGPAWATIRLADLSKISGDTLLLTIVGDQDHLVRDIDAKRIFKESTRVPLANKDYITLVSDNHGKPGLKAGHLAPIAFAKLPEGALKTGSESGTEIREFVRKQEEDEKSPDDDAGPANPKQDRTINALDFYGTWKLFDALTDAAFFGTNRDYALGNTPRQRFMGQWSDGVPVKELIVSQPK